jgi:hypothetical protein
MPGAGSIPVPNGRLGTCLLFELSKPPNQITLKLFFGVINWTEVARRYAIENK